MKVEINAEWPLVWVRWPAEELSNEAFADYLERLSALNHDAGPGKRAVIMDIARVKSLPTKQLNLQAGQVKRDAAAIAQNVVGTAFIAPSMVTRTLLKAVLALSPLASPHAVCKTEAEALAWAHEQLQKAGITPL
jgi:hypothetical protein